VAGIIPITIEAITTDIITVVVTINTITTGVTIYTGPGSLGHGAITAIGKGWILCGAEPRVHHFWTRFCVRASQSRRQLHRERESEHYVMG
jgi:hypothetical protein